ncbi:hypothetical protein SEA_RADIANCE_66 [Mycobacterium Phage Radiance]|nr:hypothetical protein SEA_RADIANCE_66 [Mycobacterium Phage Radiance]
MVPCPPPFAPFRVGASTTTRTTETTTHTGEPMSNRPHFYVDQWETLSKCTFWWTVSRPNGQIILTSEMYNRRSDAKRAARMFIREVFSSIVFRYYNRDGERVQENIRDWLRR